MNPSARLSHRLNAIFELIIDAQRKVPYQIIWDCCCDHGYLGIKILQHNLCDTLIFVDQLPHIIDDLTRKLAPFDEARHQLMAVDAAQLSFDPAIRHLVIIAGVGGDSTIDILNKIEANHPYTHIDYILCPSSKHKVLREYLFFNRFSLLSESLVADKKRYYEIIFTRGGGQGRRANSVSQAVPASCKLWNELDPEHQRYLKKISSPRGSKKTGCKLAQKIMKQKD